MEQFDNETLTTDNGLMQIKPETSRDEQLAFIDTLRNIQATQNQEIQDTTHALGTDTTPRYGGINGTNSYWLQQYQIPQTEARIATLRSAAQASALNTAMNNYLARLQENYNPAYRKASKRSRSGSSGSTTPTNPTDGSFDTEASKSGIGMGVVGWSPANKGQPQGGTITTKNGGRYGYQYQNGRLVWTDDPSYVKSGDVYVPRQNAGFNSGWDLYKAFNPLAAAGERLVNTIGGLFK